MLIFCLGLIVDGDKNVVKLVINKYIIIINCLLYVLEEFKIIILKYNLWLFNEYLRINGKYFLVFCVCNGVLVLFFERDSIFL